MPKFEVLFYQTTTGKQPAKEFCQENIKNACKRN